MPRRMTTKHGDEGTAKQTIRLTDEWIPSVHFSETDERLISFVAENLDERVVLDFFVKDREAALSAFDTLMNTLQELQIED